MAVLNLSEKVLRNRNRNIQQIQISTVRTKQLIDQSLVVSSNETHMPRSTIIKEKRKNIQTQSTTDKSTIYKEQSTTDKIYGKSIKYVAMPHTRLYRSVQKNITHEGKNITTFDSIKLLSDGHNRKVQLLKSLT